MVPIQLSVMMITVTVLSPMLVSLLAQLQILVSHWGRKPILSNGTGISASLGFLVCFFLFCLLEEVWGSDIINLGRTSPELLASLPGGDHEGLPAPECGGDVPQCSGGGGALGGDGIPAGRRSHAHHQRDQVRPSQLSTFSETVRPMKMCDVNVAAAGLTRSRWQQCVRASCRRWPTCIAKGSSIETSRVTPYCSRWTGG